MGSMILFPLLKLDRLTIRAVVPGLAALALLAGVSGASACSFHGYVPAKTLAQKVIESPWVVLARENPDQPFTFRSVRSLKGADEPVEIDQLVDSTTRRRLTANDGDAVLFALSPENGGWSRLAYVSTGERGFFLELVDLAAKWGGGNLEAERFTFFSALYRNGGEDRRYLALAELDRASYGHLRGMKVPRTTEEIVAGLRNIREQQWAPIRILLLGLIGDEASRRVVGRAIATAEASGFGGNLGAWATAYIEIDGATAIGRLRRSFLDRIGVPALQSKAILSAFAIHGRDGDSGLRLTIDRALARAMHARPDLVSDAALTFAAQGDFSRSDLFADAIASRRGHSPEALKAVYSYPSLH